MESIDRLCSQVRQLVDKAVKRSLADGILLSGGLDTSVISYVASKYTTLNAFTVAFKHAPAPDLEYSKLVAERLHLPHKIHIFDDEEMLATKGEVIKTLKVFDPMEVRNSVSILVGLRFAKKHGTRGVMTGDALDELLAGYSWLFDLKENDLKTRLKSMWQTMMFSSIPLAQSIGMEAKTPFLDHEFKRFAMNLAPKYKIRDERDKTWGKWIIRKAYETLLPDEIIWRIKTPIEYGSGTTVLPKYFESKISDEYFKDKAKVYLENDKVTIRDKEQLHNYEIYRDLFGAPVDVFKDAIGKQCPHCKSRGDERSTFCRTCGAYPI